MHSARLSCYSTNVLYLSEKCVGFWQQRKQELAGEDVKEELNAFLLFSQPALYGPCSCQELLYDNNNSTKPVKYRFN